jgi:hypothetical protein
VLAALQQLSVRLQLVQAQAVQLLLLLIRLHCIVQLVRNRWLQHHIGQPAENLKLHAPTSRDTARGSSSSSLAVFIVVEGQGQSRQKQDWLWEVQQQYYQITERLKRNCFAAQHTLFDIPAMHHLRKDALHDVQKVKRRQNCLPNPLYERVLATKTSNR